MHLKSIQEKNFGRNFGLIGAAGYIAKRHIQAIKENRGNLLCALDIRDCVGVLDSYFLDCRFFLQEKEWNSYVKDLCSSGVKLDFISICTPNYLHIHHIKLALKYNIKAICEKPLVLDLRELEWILENQDSQRVYAILQLRLHPSILELKQKVLQNLKQNPNHRFQVKLIYITPRGDWYKKSWKGDEKKSGGVASNIGVHFFDMLQFIFGMPTHPLHTCIEIYSKDFDHCSGVLNLRYADIEWFLSINKNHIPKEKNGTYRALSLDEEEVDFSTGFEDLHTKSYEKILSGEGFLASDTKNAIEIIHLIQNLPHTPKSYFASHPKNFSLPPRSLA